MHNEFIIKHSRAWLERAVIGLNLCPFAKSVHVKGQIRYVVSQASDTDQLFEDLCRELIMLHETPPEQTDTTLLIHPLVLTDFLAFNDFLLIADMTLAQLGLQGTLQIAAFHPDFQFANTDINDISNATNRAPYPTLHLIRESSLDRAVAAFPQAERIFEENIKTMQRLGKMGWAELQQTILTDAQSPPLQGEG